MLTPDELELIHGDVDGLLTPAQREALSGLLARSPEALALSTDLHRLQNLFARVPERAPPPSLRAAIAVVPAVAPSFLSRSLSQLTVALRRMEEGFMNKKTLLIGTTAVAIIAIVGGSIVGYPPSSDDVGTIGGTEISGVQRANRYRGRQMTDQDVTIANPEIAVLFQNHDVLTLVKSDVFREAMRNDAFRELANNEAFRSLSNNEAFRSLSNSEAFRSLSNNEAFREVMSNDAARQAFMSESYRELANNEAFRVLEKSAAFREASKLEAFREVMANDAFRAVMANDAFRSVMANDAFRSVMANDAFRSLQASEAFRSVSRSAALSELFMNEAMRTRE